MLQILQTKNIESYSELILSLGLEKENVSVVEATDKEEILGIGIYALEREQVTVYYIDAKNDLYLFDGIVRSILFLAVLKDVDKAVFALSDRNDLEKLGFVQKNDNCLLSLKEFMSKCKSCGKKP